MPAQILDGAKIRDEIFAELKDEIWRLTSQGVRPGLAAVLVGENPASQLYVKSKIAACEELGMAHWLRTPPASVSTDSLLQLIRELNSDNHVDGILVQLPLPAQVDSKRVLEAVDPAKDVDGFHPVNLGRLVSNRPGLVACTPAGCMEILRRYKIPIEGANAAVLGRSDIVGKPMALLLMHANATVTICVPLASSASLMRKLLANFPVPTSSLDSNSRSAILSLDGELCMFWDLRTINDSVLEQQVIAS